MPPEIEAHELPTGSRFPRRVIITGGASGIGRATALALVAGNAHVVVIDVDEAGAETVLTDPAVPTGALHFLRADVSDEEDIQDAMAQALLRLGGVDVLISAAGIMRGQLESIGQLDRSTWEQVVDVNLKGAFLATKFTAPTMSDQGRGVIILVGSKAGVSVGSGSFAYGASKGGVHGLALALERHLGPRGIRVNEVCPGDVDTPLYRRSVQEGVEHGGDQAVADVMLGRTTSPERIADVLAFLASEAASAVRGTVFTA